MPACGARGPPQPKGSRRIEGPRCGTEEILGRAFQEEAQSARWATARRPDPAELFGPAPARETNVECLRC